MKNKKWQFTYDRQMSYQRIRLFSYGYRSQISKFFDVRIDSEIYRINRGVVGVYYEENDHKAAFTKVRALFSGTESEHWFEKLKKVIEEGYVAFISFTNTLPSSYEDFDDSQLGNIVSACFRANESVSLPTWLLYLYVEEIIADELRARIYSEISQKTTPEELFKLLSHSTKALPLDVYNRELYSIALLPESEKEVALAAFADRYKSWGVYDILYLPPDVAFHAKKIKDVGADSAREEIRKIDEKYELQRSAIEKYAHHWERNERLNKLVSLYRLYADFKDWKNYYRESHSLKMRFLYEDVAKRLSLSLEDSAFLTEAEIIDALAGGKIPEVFVIEKRRENSVVLVLDDQEYIITDLEELAVVDNVVDIKTSLGEVYGTSAFRGVVTGRVVIVASAADAHKLKEGDILIASTTRPDYAPFMRACAGFVTNEGGSLSHAAIMARELKKPCVIGTKNATKVFANGDMVEVDAERGIVRKI
ncbi:hypothetical protein K2P56_00080 [Patescibacteria group bacterium]|nr:hypothetical protein [Patescibacteria group bacterium]